VEKHNQFRQAESIEESRRIQARHMVTRIEMNVSLREQAESLIEPQYEDFFCVPGGRQTAPYAWGGNPRLSSSLLKRHGLYEGTTLAAR
jgi:hypothetical protein